MHPSDSTPRPPGDFADALATPQPLLLVGGQAVNLWALYYLDPTSDLAPFVSRDADVLGDQDTLKLLGQVTGQTPRFFPLKPPTNEIGVVVAKDATGAPLLIEVLRYIRGATNEELRDPVYLFALGEKAVQVQAPGPIALLRAKIANLIEIKQTGRQDARHVLILVRALPRYLADLQASVRDKAMTERKLVDYLELLLATFTSKGGRKVCADLVIDPGQVFKGLSAEGMPRVEAFLTKRLPEALSPRRK